MHHILATLAAVAAFALFVPLATGEEPAPLLDPSKDVVCRKSAWGERCKAESAKEAHDCGAEAKHPYKPEVGIGKLWKCSGKPDDTRCKYIYDNDDECTYRKTTGKWLCKYVAWEHR